MGLAVHVPGQILGRPTQLKQRVLQFAALGRVHDDGAVVDLRAQLPVGFGVFYDLFQHACVFGRQDQALGGVLFNGEHAVAAHGVGDFDEQVSGHGVARPGEQRVHHLLGV